MFSTFPLLAELNETDDSYAQLKQYAARLVLWDANVLSTSSIFKSTSSSTKVFNQFQSSFEDFS